MNYLDPKDRQRDVTVWLREVQPMADEGTKFVTGFVCPNCQFESVGLPFGPCRFRRPQAWTFRVRVTLDLRIQCSNCDADVSREHWRLSG